MYFTYGETEILYLKNKDQRLGSVMDQIGLSKSTVHKDVAERLLHINPSLAKQARRVLDVNKSERHIRGGLATREKYLHQHGRA